MQRYRTGILAVLTVLLIAIGFISYNALANRYVREDTADSQAAERTTEEAAMPKPEHDEELEQKITAWVESQPGSFAVVVREVTAPQRYAEYAPEKRKIAASTYKLFLTHAILHEVEQGRFTLTTPVGGGTIASCIESLLEVSSDACAYDLGNLIGWEAVDGFINASGFSGTAINNYNASGGFTEQEKLTTAKDQAELAWRLATGKLLNQAHTDFILPIMKKQIWRERIAAGVPEGVEVASKPGFIYNVQNDTGIVYGASSTYAITLLSEGSSPRALAELSKIIYDHLN